MYKEDKTESYSNPIIVKHIILHIPQPRGFFTVYILKFSKTFCYISRLYNFIYIMVAYHV